MTKIEATTIEASKRAKTLEIAWVVAVVVYGVGRSLVVWKVLARYGANPLIYLVIDVGSSWPYGVATARLVRSGLRRDTETAMKWGLLAAATFISPDVYLLLTIHRAPKYVYVWIGVIVAGLGLVAVLGLRRQLLRNRNIGIEV